MPEYTLQQLLMRSAVGHSPTMTPATVCDALQMSEHIVEHRTVQQGSGQAHAWVCMVRC